MVEQSGRRTELFNLPVRDGRGDVIIDEQCHMDTRNMNVIYAQAPSGPLLTDQSAEFLRNAGLCKQ